MKKKFIAMFMTVATVLSMTACGVTAPEAPAETTPAAETKTEATATETKTETTEATTPAADAITLVMAEVNPLDTIVGMTDQKFKEEVEARSNGSIIIDLQASGVLGSENDVLDTMLGGGGTIDISRISAFALTSYGGQKSMLLSLPYIFTSREHFWNFATSDLAQEFLQEPSASAAHILPSGTAPDPGPGCRGRRTHTRSAPGPSARRCGSPRGPVPSWAGPPQ